MTWGIPLLLLTLLAGLLVPAPINLWIIGVLILTSFAAYAALEDVSPILPAAVTYSGAYLSLIEFCDPVLTAWLFIGIAFIGVGVILKQDNESDWKPLPEASFWIGGVIAGLLTFWLLLAQINLDDNISRWGNKIMHKIDPTEYKKEPIDKTAPTKEVIPSQSVDREPAQSKQKEAPRKAVSKNNFNPDDPWKFSWKSETDSATYVANFSKFNSFYIEFTTKWKSSGEIGETEVLLKRQGCFSCFRGQIIVSETGNVPFAQGNITLNKREEDCFSGSFNTRGYSVKAKLHAPGKRCQY